METHAALAGSQFQLLSHHFPARVFRQLKIVHAGHHRWQIFVRILVAVHLLPYNRQRRREGLETARRQPRASGYKLQEQSLLFPVVGAQDFVEVLDGLRILREPVIGAAALGQHSDVPPLVRRRIQSRSTEHVLQLLRVEHAQPIDREYRVESCGKRIANLRKFQLMQIRNKLLTFSQCFKLSRNALDKEPMGHQRDVLMQIVDGDGHISAPAA